MRKNWTPTMAAVAIAMALTQAAPQAQASIVPASASTLNGDFELGPSGIDGFSIFDAGNLSGWRTTASDNMVEIWTSGFLGVQAYSGTRFTELDANMASTMYQTVFGISSGSLFGYQFAHRGRATSESISVQITDLGPDQVFGTSDDTNLLNRVFTDGTAAWGFYSANNLVARGNGLRFSFESLNSGSVGNFLDAVALGVGVGGTPVNATVPEPATMLLVGVAVAAAGLVGRSSSRSRSGPLS